MAAVFVYNGRMKNSPARQIGEELKLIVERLRTLAQDERRKKGTDAEAIEIALVNVDAAVEILTE